MAPEATTSKGALSNAALSNGSGEEGRTAGRPVPVAHAVDAARVAAAVREILLAVGEDPDRDGLRDTPERVARMYAEIFSGLREDPGKHLSVTFEADHDEVVLVRDIDLYSLCEHHLVPWFGKAHVAYIPGEDGRVTGLSKLARLVEGYARRPQVQERLTSQVADTLVRVLDPRGVLVVVEAEHLCMSMRGVRKPGAVTVTSAVRGHFLTSAAARAEVLSLIGRGR
ncbi:MAG: GTP cyclohydrolase I FolE [Actinobacteria bacterium]|nr:GTP cyclohydrolase I FolE [Actinomycetota bacterium]